MRRLPLLLAALLAVATLAAAQEHAGVSLRVEPAGVVLAPGGSAVAAVLVRNEGDAPLVLHLGVATTEGDGLHAQLDHASVRLEPGASQRVGLKVNASEHAFQGARRVVVTATDGNATGATVDLPVRVGPGIAPLRPSLQLQPARLDAAPGESHDVTLRIVNPRDGPGIVRIFVAAPEGVTVDAPANVELRPREARLVTARVALAPDAPTGRSEVNFSLHDPLSSLLGSDAYAILALDVAPAAAPPASSSSAAAAGWAVAGGVAAAGGGAAGVWWLRRRGWAVPLLAPLYTRIARNRVLDHPARDRIAEAVKAAPGISFGELQRTLGIAAGQLTHHARMLEDAGVVFSTPDGQQRRFFHVGHGRVPPVPPLAERALAHLQERGAMPPARLARELGVSRQALHYHLKRLQAEGRASVDDAGRVVPLVMLTPEKK